ncbi:lectin-like domain-containing protein [Lactococcus garvieae]|uniref:lectin-like domain-containing protein n=1 Tax=Lactococcus garvieae TaxID=1363 RepID=UPI0038523985
MILKHCLKKILYTMFSKKYWLLIVLLFCLTVSFKIEAATTAESLIPGSYYDNQIHYFAIDQSDGRLPEHYVLKGGGKTKPAWDSSKHLTLIDNEPHQTAYGIFNMAFDMTSPLDIQAHIKVEVGEGERGPNPAGDGLGIIFTPQGSENFETGQTDSGLGVLGIPNSVFIGRDLYWDEGIDMISGPLKLPNGTTAFSQNHSDEITIRATDEKGNFITPQEYPKDAVGRQSIEPGDHVYIQWDPKSSNEKNVTGVLRFRLTGKGTSYKDEKTQFDSIATIETTATFQKTSSMSFVASTNTSASKLSINTNEFIIVGWKGTQIVNINYLDAVTKEPIKASKPSIIKANVGDKIGVIKLKDKPNSGDTYDYKAPEFKDYTISSITGPLSVQNYNLDLENNPNEINVYYSSTAVLKGQVKYDWDSKAIIPGVNSLGMIIGEIPSDLAIEGKEGEAFTFKKLAEEKVPEGYEISEVVGPDDKIYKGSQALEEALSANPKFISTNNKFQIHLKAKIQEITWDVSYLGLPLGAQREKLRIIRDYTGAPLGIEEAQVAEELLEQWIKDHRNGWLKQEYSNVYQTGYRSFREAMEATGGYVLSSSNIYTSKLQYNGGIGFISVPNTIDFGNHKVAPNQQVYRGKADQSLSIFDTRAPDFQSNWHLSVSEIKPLHNEKQDIIFKNQIFYQGSNQALNDEEQEVFSSQSITNPLDTKFVIINKEEASPFTLQVPTEYQKINTKFEGEIRWTLTISP